MRIKKITLFMLTQLLFISFFTSNLAYALDIAESTTEDTKVYTYEDLFEIAKKNNKEIQKKAKQIERSEIMREEVARRKTYTPVGIGTGDPSDVLARATIQGLIAADINLQTLNKQIESEEDKLAYNVKTALNKLLLAQNKLLLDENARDITELELKLANIQYNSGIIGKYELTKFENNYIESTKNIDTSRLTLESAYLELNNIVGLNKDERYNIKIDNKEIQEVPELERHIRKVLNNSPIIWTLEKGVELAEWSLRLHSYNAGDDPYKAKEIDVATAKMSLSDAKKTIEHSLRTLYKSIEHLREVEEILQINLQKIKEDFEIAELKLELGITVPLEVKKLQNAIAELEHKLLENRLKYEELVAVYEKPWVVSN